ncbi:MAG: hypothetical protein IJR55_03985 [Clostridia bacterium]|nr:hypothetical protein [Clostridia bacterium]
MNKNVDISAVDKNFAASVLEEDGIEYYDADQAPLRVYGLIREDGVYARVPSEVAKQASEQLEMLNHNTAGGRVRLKTDSDVIYIKCMMPQSWRMRHMADAGSSGFDVYEVIGKKHLYLGVILPPRENVKEYTEKINVPEGMHDIEINMPLYSAAGKVYVGVKKGSRVLEGGRYTYEKPIVYYGSSITQGACASRPGNTYQGMISRRFDTNYINLGYSGNAKGHPAMIKYISTLDMSIFVLDYDHNAVTPEKLKDTHYAAYKTVRDAQPGLPIIMASRTDFDKPLQPGKPFRDVVAETYERAIAEGDKNVYFIDGEKEFKHFVREGRTVDGSHPNDLGFEKMAKVFGKIIGKLLK